MSEKRDRKPPGPKPDRLKLKGDWADAMRRALQKDRPTDGWPKHPRLDDNESRADH